MNCPKCTVGKLSEVTVRIQVPGADQELVVDQCFTCEGVWFDANELETYLRQKLTSLNSGVISDEVLKELNRRVGKCPRCQIPMSRRRAPTKRQINVDYCQKCNGYWLDCTEVDQIEPRPSIMNMLEDFFNYLGTLTGHP